MSLEWSRAKEIIQGALHETDQLRFVRARDGDEAWAISLGMAVAEALYLRPENREFALLRRKFLDSLITQVELVKSDPLLEGLYLKAAVFTFLDNQKP